MARLELVCPEADRSFFVRTPTTKEYWEFYDECRARPEDADGNLVSSTPIESVQIITEDEARALLTQGESE